MRRPKRARGSGEAECCQQEAATVALAGKAKEAGGKGVPRGHFGGEAHRQVTPPHKHLELTAASWDLPTQTAETAWETADALPSPPHWDDGGSEASRQTAGGRSPGTVND